MNNRLLKKAGLIFALGLLMAIGFQNCTPAQFDKTISQASKMTLGVSGNGEPYEGKPTIYNAYNLAQPCVEKGANQKPLPNHQIHHTPNYLKLVRENCSDLAIPKDVSPAEVTVEPIPGQISYAGVSYSEQAILNDFDVVAASCPAGMTLKSNAARNNLVISGLHLFDGVWDQSEGVPVTMTGSLAGMPRFHFTRTADGLQWYERPQQAVPVVSGNTYAYTFLARKENVPDIYIGGYYNPDVILEAYFNLDTGISRDVGSRGVSNISFSSRPFSGGYIVTVFFTSPLSAPITLGVAPGPALGPNLLMDLPQGQAGDSIAVTSFQLEEVSQYCNP